MGWYTDRLLPRLTDRVLGTDEIAAWRRRAVAGLSGTVVEIGFGSGLNLPVYPPEVNRILAVEPAAVARELAAGRAEAAAASVDHIGLDGQHLPLADDSVDGALATFTLCTVPDPALALAELHRVLRPGGRFHFVEHGLAPEPRIARWQHRLDPIQKRAGGGCHLSRDIPALTRAAGFELDLVDADYLSRPSPWTWLTVGHARKPEPDVLDCGP